MLNQICFGNDELIESNLIIFRKYTTVSQYLTKLEQDHLNNNFFREILMDVIHTIAA